MKLRIRKRASLRLSIGKPAFAKKVSKRSKVPKKKPAKSTNLIVEKSSVYRSLHEEYNQPMSSINLKELLIKDCSVVLEKSIITTDHNKEPSTPLENTLATKRSQRLVKSNLKETNISSSQRTTRAIKNDSNKASSSFPQRITRTNSKEDSNKKSLRASNKSPAASQRDTRKKGTAKSGEKVKANKRERATNSKEQIKAMDKCTLTKGQLTLKEATRQSKRNRVEIEPHSEEQSRVVRKRALSKRQLNLEEATKQRKKKKVDVEPHPEDDHSSLIENDALPSETSQNKDTTASDTSLRFEPKSFYGVNGNRSKAGIKSKTSLTSIKPISSSDVYTFDTPTSPKKTRKGKKKRAKPKVLASVENKVDPLTPDKTKRFFMTRRSKLADNKKEVIATVSRGKFNLNFPTGDVPTAILKQQPRKKRLLKPEVPLTTSPTIDFLRKADPIPTGLECEQENLGKPSKPKSPSKVMTSSQSTSEVATIPLNPSSNNSSPSQAPPDCQAIEEITTAAADSNIEKSMIEESCVDLHLPGSPISGLGFEKEFERSMELDSQQKISRDEHLKSFFNGGQSSEEDGAPQHQPNRTYVLEKDDLKPKSPKKNVIRDFYTTSQKNQIQGENSGLITDWLHPVASSTPVPKVTRRRALEADQDNQMVIDAGQKEMEQCPSCQMVYARGKPGDEKLHLKYHHHYTNTLKFKGWKKETVVREYPDGRVVVVTSSDPKFMLRKVEEVHELIDKELGFQPIVAAQTHQKTFLFISNAMEVAGLVTADAISKAYPLVSRADDEEANIEDCKISRNGYCCSQESISALCGIIRLWTAPQYRRQKIATRILDCIRHSFIHGHYLQMDQIAFSDPTTRGHQFALAYCKSESYLIHLA